MNEEQKAYVLNMLQKLALPTLNGEEDVNEIIGEAEENIILMVSFIARSCPFPVSQYDIYSLIPAEQRYFKYIADTNFTDGFVCCANEDTDDCKWAGVKPGPGEFNGNMYQLLLCNSEMAICEDCFQKEKFIYFNEEQFIENVQYVLEEFLAEQTADTKLSKSF